MKKITLLTKVGQDPKFSKPGAQVEVADDVATDWIDRKIALEGFVKPTVAQYATAPGYSPNDFDPPHPPVTDKP